jgi:cysteine desulfurase/selenocysteine lyase
VTLTTNGVSDGPLAGHIPFDIARIRRDFPILKREVAPGVPLVYLDNAATSQRPVQVIAEITRYYRDHNANIHRGVHTLSVESTEMYEGAREKIAKFINAPDTREVVFTRNTTESINLVAHGWGRKFLQAGDEVVLTEIEHHSNIVPWQMLRDERGIVLRFIPMLPDGTLDMDEARRLIGPKTKLVSFTAMSNALGSIVDVPELVAMAKAEGATVLVDGAQSVPHLPVDVQALGIDFLAFSGHKMLGPNGIGVLWGRLDLLDSMDPFMGGGDMILTVTLDRSTWADVPAKFEAGTPDISGAIGLGVAVDYLNAIGMAQVRKHEIEITDYALRCLSDVPGLSIFGRPNAEERGGVISFELEGIHPHDVGQVLDTHGVAIRTGHHCAQPVMAALDVPATARASFYLYNTTEEVDALVDALEQTNAFFGGGR